MDKADRAMMEFKRCPVVEVKVLDEEERILEGWISTEALDYQDDIMEAEGCDESEFDGTVLAGHRVEPEFVVGGGEILEKRKGKGVKARWQLAKGEPGIPLIADQLWSLIKQGFLKKLSVGFKTIESVMEQTNERWIRRVTKWKLFEFSHVGLAANRWAEVETIKAMLEAMTVKGEVPRGVSEGEAVAPTTDIVIKKSTPYDPDQETVTILNSTNLFKAWLIDEVKAGRVLSGANETRLRTAVGVILEVLDQVTGSESEDDDKAAGLLDRIATDATAWNELVKGIAELIRPA